jgi:hemerythrin-like metal-binding protein
MAQLIEWKPHLSVGVQQLDEEHKRLISFLNDLHAGMLARHGKETLGPILDGLIKYTRTHFDNEEALLRKHGYPGFHAHLLEHERLASEVLAKQAAFKSSGGGVMLNIETMQFLRNWLLNHVEGTDKKYTAFLNAKGVK